MDVDQIKQFLDLFINNQNLAGWCSKPALNSKTEKMDTLIKTQEFFKTLDLVITPLIVIIGTSGQQYHNKAFDAQIGYSANELPDFNNWFKLAYPDEKYRKEVRQKWLDNRRSALHDGESHVHLMSRVYCADGTYHWFDIHENQIGSHKVVTFLDVNEQQDSNEELLDALKQKDILLSVIAHDVRSPLSSIRQVIRNYGDMEFTANELKAVFSGLDVQIDYIFNIINTFLVRTSVEKGRFIEQVETIRLAEFFHTYVDYYRERMHKQNISFAFELTDKDVLAYDPFVLDVICRNLIDNAIKYSPENGKIYISFLQMAGRAEITIRDTGAGMTQQQEERIFNNVGSPRLNNQITDSFGLGLTMAKQILENHGGKLSIDSKPGEGTAFTIHIN